MKKYGIILIIILLLISSLCVFSGCGSRDNEEDGVFVPDSEEYIILDEGKQDDSRTKKGKGSSNTNAKKASDKNEEKNEKSEEEKTMPSPSEAPSSSTSSHPTDSGGSGVIENELPVIPADSAKGSDTNNNKKTSKNGSQIVQDADIIEIE